MSTLFQKTKVERDFSKLNKLIYGWPKTGKTTLAAQQKDANGREPLFIATEDGHSALEVYAQRVTTWDGFCKLVDLILANKQAVVNQHSCFVVDLISDLDQMCGEAVAKKHGVTHVADMDYGKGFSLQRQEFQTVMRKLMDVLPCTFIAHCADKEIMWNNEKAKVQAPSLSKGALDFINGKVDCVMWMLPANSRKIHPEVTMKNSLTSIAGSRHRQLARSFVFHVNDPAKTYAEIQTVFAKEKYAVLDSTDTSEKPVKAPEKSTAQAIQAN